jgi:hypothetical protein
MSKSSTPVCDGVRCPMCDEPGWPSSMRVDAYAATCGSAWSGDGSFLSRSEACRTIGALRLELALRDIAALTP